MPVAEKRIQQQNRKGKKFIHSKKTHPQRSGLLQSTTVKNIEKGLLTSGEKALEGTSRKGISRRLKGRGGKIGRGECGLRHLS